MAPSNRNRMPVDHHDVGRDSRIDWENYKKEREGQMLSAHGREVHNDNTGWVPRGSRRGGNGGGNGSDPIRKWTLDELHEGAGRQVGKMVPKAEKDSILSSGNEDPASVGAERAKRFNVSETASDSLSIINSELGRRREALNRNADRNWKPDPNVHDHQAFIDEHWADKHAKRDK